MQTSFILSRLAFLLAPSTLIAAMATPTKHCAVIGVGVLGTSLCRQLLDDGWQVTGLTKSTTRHPEIQEAV